VQARVGELGGRGGVEADEELPRAGGHGGEAANAVLGQRGDAARGVAAAAHRERSELGRLVRRQQQRLAQPPAETVERVRAHAAEVGVSCLGGGGVEEGEDSRHVRPILHQEDIRVQQQQHLEG